MKIRAWFTASLNHLRKQIRGDDSSTRWGLVQWLSSSASVAKHFLWRTFFFFLRVEMLRLKDGGSWFSFFFIIFFFLEIKYSSRFGSGPVCVFVDLAPIFCRMRSDRLPHPTGPFIRRNIRSGDKTFRWALFTPSQMFWLPKSSPFWAFHSN